MIQYDIFVLKVLNLVRKHRIQGVCYRNALSHGFDICFIFLVFS